MLQIKAVSTFAEKAEYLKTFDPEKQTWLVSDLRSKFDLQTQFLKENEVLEEDAILRASELWKKLSVRYLSEFRIVSVDFAKSFAAPLLQKSEKEWVRRPGTVDSVIAVMTQFLPILAHPAGHEVMAEWFSQNEKSRVRWQPWLEICADLWQSFLEKKILTAQWLAGALLEQAIDLSWDKELIVDLGADLTPVEASLLKTMAKEGEVLMMEPHPEWRGDYETSLISYDFLSDRSTQFSASRGEVRVDENISFLKFSTMLGEVKNAAGQVRAWIDRGVAAEDIAVVAADIESYWGGLRSHLRFEGVPVAKSTVSRIQSLPSVSRWLSRLRLQMGEIRSSDLETHLFADTKPLMSYEEFQQLFEAIYSHEDLQRSEQISKYYQDELDPDEKLDVEEFLKKSLRFWPSPESTESLEGIVHRIYQECPRHVKLAFQQWKTYLEMVVSKIETTVEEAPPKGLQCLSLMAAEYTEARYLIFLGATEGAMRSSSRHGLSTTEALRLLQDTGFVLTPSDHSQKEFEARWLLTKSFEEVVFSYPAADFEGAAQAPALFWLQGRLAQNLDPEKLDRPKDNCWDSENELPEEIAQVLGEEKETEKQFAKNQLKSLSATSLERYLECPFRFATEKLFMLKDRPNLDLDVDAQTKGMLMHALFESFLSEEKWDYSDEEISERVDRCREEKELKLADERLWPPLRQKYVEMGRRFLDFEKEWRSEFPQTKTLGREVAIDCGLDGESGELVEKSESSIRFRGSIDRLDIDQEGNAAVIDYKSSEGSLKQYPSWLANDQLQLALYAQAVEKGLAGHEAKDVIAAIYYVGRTLNRETGFLIKEKEGTLFKLKSARRNKMSHEEKEELFSKLGEKIAFVVQKIESGFFSAEPKDVKTCLKCRWSGLCRAPHLN